MTTCVRSLPAHGMRRTISPLAAVAAVLAAASAGCALSSEPEGDTAVAGPNMQAILNEASAAGKNPVEIHPAWLYPGQPTGFFVVCPYLPRDAAETITGARLPEIPAHGLDDSVNAVVIVYDSNHPVVQQYPLGKVNMCTTTGQRDSVFDTDSTIIFEPAGTGWKAIGFGHQTRAQGRT